MLKHNFVFAVSLVAMFIVGIGSARADIPSTVYVQQGVQTAKDAADSAQESADNAQDSADLAQAAAEAAQASADAAAASAQTANEAVALKQDKLTAGTNITIASDGTISATDTTYSTGNASKSGLTKLYTDTGTNTDGTMTQSALKTALDAKVPTAQGSTNKNKAVITDTNGNITTGTIATGMIANSAVTAAKTSGVIGSIPSGSATSTTYATIWVE